ncbi:MAG: damage-control phosphatase ARMT1 family protein [Deltaproteobacteria bacterium]
MQVKPDCMPCYLVQCLSALSRANIDEQRQQAILSKISPELALLSPDRTPSFNSSLVLLRCYDLAGVEDPFAQAKQASNRHALRILDDFAFDPKADDALIVALKLALAGNVIDLGIQDSYDIESSLAEVMKNEIDEKSLQDFISCLDTAQNILVVGDNSGEIVFDTVLIQVMQHMGKDVVYSVKGGPILNDATKQDAIESGMIDLAPVIDTGNRFLGVEWKLCSEKFQQHYLKADLVIAKGQANYESLEGCAHAGPKTFFLLKAKCPVVADSLGVALGDWVLRRNLVR